jgi:uncharacterized integral membrane protein (TIGR00697 family)
MNKTLSSKRLEIFIYLLTFHTALLVASNAGGAKMIALPGGLAASATVFSYMGTFVILDAISELFGKKFSIIAINVGLTALVVSVLFFQLSIASAPAPFWKGQEGYVATLGSSWRILLGGWTAYMVSQRIDLWSFFKIRNITGGKYGLWSRALGSTVIGQLIDTIIFITIAFYGSFPLMPAIIGQYLLKLILAVITTPLVYMVVGLGRSLITFEDSKTNTALDN